MSLIVFTENIQPVKHVWFVGDDILEQTANSLRKLHNQHVFDASKPELFIYKEYHVEAFHDSEIKPTYRNIIRKVRNNLTMALNKFPTILPNYLVIMVNNSYIHDPTFVEFELKSILKRVLNDVNRLLTSRSDQVVAKNSNLCNQTEVYMMRPLPKPAKALSLKSDYSFKNTRRHFNQILDKLARTCDFVPLNIDEINCAQRALFEKNGDLSDYGKERLWVSISEFIKTRDRLKQKALSTIDVTKRERAVQTDDTGSVNEQLPEKGGNENFPNNEGYDAYYTGNEPYQRNTNTSHWQSGRRESFDNYHRNYDRDDYQRSYYDHEHY